MKRFGVFLRKSLGKPQSNPFLKFKKIDFRSNLFRSNSICLNWSFRSFRECSSITEDSKKEEKSVSFKTKSLVLPEFKKKEIWAEDEDMPEELKRDPEITRQLMLQALRMIRGKDVEGVRKLISETKELREKRVTELHLACMLGDAEFVEAAIKHFQADRKAYIIL